MLPEMAEGTDAAFGALPGDGGVLFRVWAPAHHNLDVVIETADGRTIAQPMSRSRDAVFSADVPGVRAGDRYRYRTDRGLFPDPASRFQPDGVHGPSEIIDFRLRREENTGWRGLPREDLIIYELHIGTFTPEGTFDAARRRLPDLKELGVTAIELMPVADFPGERNWGYDGVSLFAPARCYGRPEDLRALIDAAHRLGLAVLLDVVYNHLGPEGNYLGIYTDHFTAKRPDTPWGATHNYDGEHSEHVREFVIQNAIHWIRDYGFDGLRLDATHVIFDDGPRHILAELSERVKAAVPNRHVVLIAEDHRNLNHMLTPPAAGGWGLDGVWADGFHHHTRRMLAGDREGYFQDFSGTTEDLVATIEKGWFFCGEHSTFYNEPIGTDPSMVEYPQFIYCLQNHDQVGNRAFGERLHHQIDLAAYRAATAMLLLGPATPLLFMGQEWAASTPFLYFTHHSPDLGKLVTEGRRKEFSYFAAFSDPAVRETIPDPQAASTFHRSKLIWDEREAEPHASVLRLYRTLLKLRRTEPALRSRARDDFRVHALDDGVLWFERRGGRSVVVVVRLKGSGRVELPELPRCEWEVLTTEDAPFAPEPRRPRISFEAGVPVIDFPGPAAVILRGGAA